MARDIYHSNVRNALVKDGWEIYNVENESIMTWIE
jgi:hypothetical protein